MPDHFRTATEVGGLRRPPPGTALGRRDHPRAADQAGHPGPAGRARRHDRLPLPDGRRLPERTPASPGPRAAADRPRGHRHRRPGRLGGLLGGTAQCAPRGRPALRRARRRAAPRSLPTRPQSPPAHGLRAHRPRARPDARPHGTGHPGGRRGAHGGREVRGADRVRPVGRLHRGAHRERKGGVRPGNPRTRPDPIPREDLRGRVGTGGPRRVRHDGTTPSPAHRRNPAGHFGTHGEGSYGRGHFPAARPEHPHHRRAHQTRRDPLRQPQQGRTRLQARPGRSPRRRPGRARAAALRRRPAGA